MRKITTTTNNKIFLDPLKLIQNLSLCGGQLRPKSTNHYSIFYESGFKSYFLVDKEYTLSLVVKK